MSAITLTFPTSEDLRRVEQVLVPQLAEADPLFGIMPMREVDSHIISWIQKDSFTGLQQIRGLGGAPSRVQRVEDNRYTMTPGVYGEYMDIDEIILTAKADPVTMRPINLTSEVAECQLQLLQRRFDRIKYIGWNALMGRFSVANGRGVIHTDAFDVQYVDVSTAWNDYDDSTPLVDLSTIANTYSRGRSCSFRSDATLYGTGSTISDLYLNVNPEDLGGKKIGGGNTTLGLGDTNKVLEAFGLPQLKPYDGGYFSEGTKTWNTFIPDGYLLLVGKRMGATPGYYAMTRNAQTGQPGAYSFVDDDPKRVPRSPRVHDGHNGGPCLEFPGDVVLIKTR